MTSVDDTQPLITHLVELRNRLLRSIIFVAVIFIALVYFSNEIYYFVAAPLTANLPNGSSMIATNIATPFFTPIKLTGVVAIFISVPFLQHCRLPASRLTSIVCWKAVPSSAYRCRACVSAWPSACSNRSRPTPSSRPSTRSTCSRSCRCARSTRRNSRRNTASVADFARTS